MVREKIESAKDAAENAVIETTAQAMVQGTLAVRKLTAKRYGKIIMTVACMAVMMGAMAIVAAAEADAEGTFTTIQTEITKWVGRIGGLVVLFGGIGAGMGIANQDEAGRNRGFMTMAGGAVLIAIVGVVGATSGGGA